MQRPRSQTVDVALSALAAACSRLGVNRAKPWRLAFFPISSASAAVASITIVPPGLGGRRHQEAFSTLSALAERATLGIRGGPGQRPEQSVLLPNLAYPKPDVLGKLEPDLLDVYELSLPRLGIGR